MLQHTKELYGLNLSALDGSIGRAQDFCFDVRSWLIRYLVANSDGWLPGRQILLSPHAFGRLDSYQRTLHLKLPRKQIQSSPVIESRQPVSRQFEEQCFRHYNWPVYWESSARRDRPLQPPEPAAAHEPEPSHLLSTQALNGCQVRTGDGIIGHVTGLMVDDRSWAIRELVVATGHWNSCRETLIPSARVEQISPAESTVTTSFTMGDIRRNGGGETALAGLEKQAAGAK